MSALAQIIDYPEFDAAGYDEAVRTATIRAQHSFFDQHVIEAADGSYRAIDEGDYNALPQAIIERIVHTVTGKMADDFDGPDEIWTDHSPTQWDEGFGAKDCPF